MSPCRAASSTSQSSWECLVAHDCRLCHRAEHRRPFDGGGIEVGPRPKRAAAGAAFTIPIAARKADSSGRRNTAGVTLQLGLPRFCGAVRVSGLTASRLVFLPVSFGSAAIIFPSRPAACSGRRAERRSGTAGRLSARPGSALPGRSLTGASTAAGWCAPGSRALARTPLARGSRVRNGGDADYRSLRLTREDGPASAKPDHVTAASRPAPLRAFSSRASFSAWR
jgi:hypothetical protein